MKRICIFAVIALSAACAAAPEPEPVTVPQPAPDPRIGEMQTQLTELLERIDVLNERLSRVEQTAVAPAAASSPSVAAPATEPAAAPAPVASALAPQAAVVGARLAEDYRQAIMLYGKGRHADARAAFDAVFRADPSGDLADNALFWIGETYFAAGDYTNAVRFYNRVVTEFADQNKAPDALFKTALAQERTGDLALARRTLQQVIQRYPYSTPASSAKAELQRIKF